MPLNERKRKLAAISDLEGVVAKPAQSVYATDGGTTWLKIKNPNYTQIERRHELFEARPRNRSNGARRVVG